MTFKLPLASQIQPAAAVARNLPDEFLHLVAPGFGQIVQFVGFGAAAKFGKRIAHGDFLARNFSELNFFAMSGNQDQTSPALWHSVIGGIENGMIDRVSQSLKFGVQCFEAPILGEFRNIFEHDCLRAHRPDKSQEFKNQIVLLVLANATVKRRHRRKALARRTASEKVKLAAPNFQPAHNLGCGNFCDVLFPNYDAFVVGFVCLNRKRINFDSTHDAKPGLRQAQREAAAS